MIAPESHLGVLPKPHILPGLDMAASVKANSNPFSGIRRAGQAKRAQNFEKFQQNNAGGNLGPTAPNASFDGSKYQLLGGVKGTQVGSMRQMKFS